MSWPEVFLVFGLCHLTGDFLLQTEWQVRHKPGGLGRDPLARRALTMHVLTYTLAFVPALIWIGDELGAATAVIATVAIALPHMVVDDRRLVVAYVRRVKRVPDPPPLGLLAAVDQTTHAIMLWAVAVAVV